MAGLAMAGFSLGEFGFLSFSCGEFGFVSFCSLDMWTHLPRDFRHHHNITTTTIVTMPPPVAALIIITALSSPFPSPPLSAPSPGDDGCGNDGASTTRRVITASRIGALSTEMPRRLEVALALLKLLDNSKVTSCAPASFEATLTRSASGRSHPRW